MSPKPKPSRGAKTGQARKRKSPSRGPNKPLLNRSGEAICRTGDCRKPLYPGLNICRGHARDKAFRLWSQLTPKTVCEARGLHGIIHKCNGVLVAGHGLSRVYPATAFDPLNRFVICSSLNFLTEQTLGLQWDEWIKKRWGVTVYEEMRRKAMQDPEPDLAVVLNELQRSLKDAA